MRVVSETINHDVQLNTQEIWKDMPSDLRYEVSSFGRVKNKKTGKIRKPSSTPAGYQVIVLTYKNKKSKGVYVHREVMAAFKGSCPAGLNVSHINGNNCDNRLVNLCYETHLENIRRKKEHGTQTHGESHGTARLTEKEVSEIRNKRKSGMKLLEIAKLYGISFQHVSRICKRENWFV